MTTIDGFIFDIYENVKTRYVDPKTSQIKIEFHQKKPSIEKIQSGSQFFFLFETSYHDAFMHWIFESAVFLPFISKLNNYRGIKVITSSPVKKYKKLFFNIFGVEYLEIKDDIIPFNNVCVSCRNLTFNNKSIDTTLLNTLLINFKKAIQDGREFINGNKVEHLFFPRNNRENYKNNYRVIDYTKIKQLLDGKDHVIYDTLTTEDFRDQIQLLRNSKNVYLDYGSSFFVNGMFCLNNTIYVNQVIKSQWKYPGMRHLLKMIETDNKVIFI